MKMICARLKMYGSPEASESAVFGRSEAFLKSEKKDSQKLQELADHLYELGIAKQDGKLLYLVYLDTECNLLLRRELDSSVLDGHV